MKNAEPHRSPHSVELVGQGFYRNVYLLRGFSPLVPTGQSVPSTAAPDLVLKVPKLLDGGADRGACDFSPASGKQGAEAAVWLDKAKERPAVSPRDCSRNEARHALEAAALALTPLKGSPFVAQDLGLCGSTLISEALAERLEDVVKQSAFARLQGREGEDPLGSPLAVVKMARDAAAAVASFHAAGVVSADVDLPQFLRRENGTVVLSDLNRGRLLQRKTPTFSSFSPPSAFLDQEPPPSAEEDFCPFYIPKSRGRWRSPEEHRGDAHLTEKVDVYSLGMVLWNLATSEATPFKNLIKNQVTHAVLSGGRPPLPSDACQGPLRSALCVAVKQRWRQDPSTRPPAAEVLSFLSSALEKHDYSPRRAPN